MRLWLTIWVQMAIDAWPRNFCDTTIAGPGDANNRKDDLEAAAIELATCFLYTGRRSEHPAFTQSHQAKAGG